MSPEEKPETPEGQKGYFSVPRQLRVECMTTGINTIKLVYFIADETLGWASHWALLTYTDILDGCTWHSGEGSGLPNDTAISRAIKEAVDRQLIEVRTVPAGTLYAVHRRFWTRAKLLPKWTVYKRLPYDATADPLALEQATITMIAQQLAPPEDDSPLAITMIATDYQGDSKPLSPGLQPTIKVIAEKSDEDTPGQGPEAPNKALKESLSNKIEKESVAASPRSPFGSPDVLLEKEEEQEAVPDMLTLRIDYATLSEQLEHLDANKQAGQWARLYKQVQAAEERLRQAEQDAPPSSAAPPEYAKQNEVQASDEETPPPVAEGTAADERQEQLRALAGDLLYWKGGLKVLRQAQLPKWRGCFKWQIEAKIEALQAAYATLRTESAKPDG